MNLDEIRNLDTEDPGSWPAVVKAVALIAIIAIIVAAVWYFFWQDQAKQLEEVKQKESELRSTFEQKQERAANLEAYEAQLAEMRETFGDLLRQLPSKAEVSALLVDISQTGLSSGLEFDLFKPQGANEREFYAELPVQIKVRGSYTEFAEFISGVANLPRIVTLNNVSIQPISKEGAKGPLRMNLTAKTYWYLEEEGQG